MVNIIFSDNINLSEKLNFVLFIYKKIAKLL